MNETNVLHIVKGINFILLRKCYEFTILHFIQAFFFVQNAFYLLINFGFRIKKKTNCEKVEKKITIKIYNANRIFIRHLVEMIGA